MNRLIHVLALLLPLAGLGAVWAQTERLSRQGTEWDVPVSGYDPRDLLRGHYVLFRYDWPGMKRENLPGSNLCLEGRPPQLVRVRQIDEGNPASGGRPCAEFAAGSAFGPDGSGGTIGGRLYASRDAALAMQEKLADPKFQGVIRIRLRPDGHITPLRLRFRPRPPAPQGQQTAAVPVAPLPVIAPAPVRP